MGTKRVGWARIKSLINENQNELKLRNTQVIHVNDKATTLGAGQSGATVFWTHGTTHNITLPPAQPGMSFKLILTVGAAAAHNVSGSSGDSGFYGKATVTKSGASDEETSTQNVVKGSMTALVKLHKSTAALGGNTGDVIDFICFEKGYWVVDARLSNTSTPASTAVFADS